MTPALIGTLLAIACAGIEGVAQLALKQSTREPARRSAWIAIGLAFFAVEAVLYTAALQRLDVAMAYSLGALGFVTVALLSRFVLRERISPARWLGIVFIVVGSGVLALHG